MKFNLFKKKEAEVRGLDYISNPVQAFGLQTLDIDVSPLALSAVYRAITLISESLATLPFSVKVVDGSRSETLTNHPVNLIFRNLTDSNITFFELIKQLVQSVLLFGDGFAYIYRDGEGNAKKLRFLKYGDVIIDYDEQKDILYYKCSKVTRGRIEPKNMIHLKKFTKDGIHGISIIKSAWRTLQIGSFADATAKEFFGSGGAKKGYLKANMPVTPEQKQQAATDWNQAYGSANFGNRIAVLGTNFDYTQLTESAADAQLIESRQFNVQEIARYFGISPVLLGDLTHSSYSTIEASLLQFLSQTLQPYIILIEQEFSRKLLKPSEINLTIDIDDSAVLLTDKVSLANYYKTLISSGVYSINEARIDLGMPEVEGGDDHVIPYSDISQNKLGNTDDEDEKTQDDNLNK